MEEQLVSLSTVHTLIAAEEGKRELSYEQRLALQHAEHFAIVDAAKGEALQEGLRKVDERISPGLAIKLRELLPRTPEEVRAIITKERYSLETAQIEKIVALIEEALS